GQLSRDHELGRVIDAFERHARGERRQPLDLGRARHRNRLGLDRLLVVEIVRRRMALNEAENARCQEKKRAFAKSVHETIPRFESFDCQTGSQLSNHPWHHGWTKGRLCKRTHREWPGGFAGPFSLALPLSLPKLYLAARLMSGKLGDLRG